MQTSFYQKDWEKAWWIENAFFLHQFFKFFLDFSLSFEGGNNIIIYFFHFVKTLINEYQWPDHLQVFWKPGLLLVD